MPITISGSGTVTGIITGGLPNNIVTYSGIAATTFASVTDMAGITTVGIATSGSSAVTLIGSGLSGNIFNGDYVTGAGVIPGTTVSSGGGTLSLVLSANVGLTSSLNPLTFYSGNKIVTEGVIGGQLCRAWVNFNGTSTVAIRASYNVSSITDNGTGNYTVNFTTAMPDANYCTHFTGSAVAAGTYDYTDFFDFTTTSVRLIYYHAATNAATDVDQGHMSIFR